MTYLIFSTAFFLVGSAIASDTAGSRVTPLPRAHAHNDYNHKRPLFDALSHGFCSVEADIMLSKGKLYVGHGLHEIKPGRTLETLYLRPLLERVKKNKGRVYRNGPGFTLLIDIKTDGEKTYSALRKILPGYDSILTKVTPTGVKKGAVTIIISGNRAKETIASQKVRYCGIDGRIIDLDSEIPAHLLPLISDNWNKFFRWKGRGNISQKELDKLKMIVKKAHDKKRKVRFWAIPHDKTLWKTLLDAKVDYINTDDLEGLENFLKKQRQGSTRKPAHNDSHESRNTNSHNYKD